MFRSFWNGQCLVAPNSTYRGRNIAAPCLSSSLFVPLRFAEVVCRNNFIDVDDPFRCMPYEGHFVLVAYI